MVPAGVPGVRNKFGNSGPRRKHGAFAALAPTIRAHQAAIIDAPNEVYALRADRLAKEHSLKIVLRGSGREYRQLESIAALRRTFILPVDFPKPPDVSSATAALDASLQSLMHWHLAPENPGRLEKAGVEFVLTTDTLSSPADLLPNLKKAIKRGLSECCPEALTAGPAKLLEVDHLAGTLEIGKLANILVTDGPLFAESTKIQETWVAGNRDNWNKEPETDLRGTWKLTMADDAVVQEFELKLSGSRKKLKRELGLVGAFVKQQDEPAGKPESKQDEAADTDGEKKAEDAAATKSSDEPTEDKAAEQSATKPETKSENEEKEIAQKPEVKSPAKTELKQLEFNGYRLAANFNAAVFKEARLSGVAYFSAVVTEQRTVAEFSGSVQWPDGTSTAYTATLPAVWKGNGIDWKVARWVRQKQWPRQK